MHRGTLMQRIINGSCMKRLNTIFILHNDKINIVCWSQSEIFKCVIQLCLVATFGGYVDIFSFRLNLYYMDFFFFQSSQLKYLLLKIIVVYQLNINFLNKTKNPKKINNKYFVFFFLLQFFFPFYSQIRLIQKLSCQFYI